MSMPASARPEPQWGQTLYRSSRAKTIVAIFLAVLALAGAGVLAGALVDAPNSVEDSPIDTQGGPPPPASAPIVMPQVETSPSAAASDLGSPSPAPSASSVASPTPAPSPTAQGTDSTGGIVLGGGVVTIPVPSPWQGEAGDTGTFANLASGQNDWIYAQVGPPGTTTSPAESVLAQSYLNFLPPESYTQLQQGEIQTQEAWGAVTSLAYFTYTATYVDTQGATPLGGAMWVAVRQDGALLIMTAESIPTERFPTRAWKPIIDGAFNDFANPAI